MSLVKFGKPLLRITGGGTMSEWNRSHELWSLRFARKSSFMTIGKMIFRVSAQSDPDLFMGLGTIQPSNISKCL